MRSHHAQTEPVEALRARQLRLLQELVTVLHRQIPMYRERMAAAGMEPADLTSLDDAARLPFTYKTDMREGFPYGLFAAVTDDIVEVHLSSGTTGKPVVAGYTAADVDLWREVMARTLDMGEVGPADIVQDCFGLGLFTGGFGVHYGAQALGAMVIPIGSGNTHRQLETMVDLGTTVLTCTPSYGLYLAEYGADHGVDLAAGPLRAGFFGAEPWSDAMRLELEKRLGIEAFDIYGLTEIIGPGVAAECHEHDGLHVFEDHFYPEIVDPDTGEVLPDGTKGELVLTSLTRQGTPVLRYRTRDITYLNPEPCPCGRTSRRIRRIMGRSDDLLIIRGVNVFPAQVEQVLARIEGVEPHYQLIVDRQGAMDTLLVEVEMAETLFSDDVGAILALQDQIETEMKGELGIQTICQLVNPKSIPRSEGKAQRIVDRREVPNRAEQ